MSAETPISILDQTIDALTRLRASVVGIIEAPNETYDQAMLRLKWTGTVHDALRAIQARRRDERRRQMEEMYGNALWKYVAERAQNTLDTNS